MPVLIVTSTCTPTCPCTGRLSRDDFLAVELCQAGELDIVKAMVERTQVDLEARE